MDPTPRSSRLAWACDRCRRQKLKCDIEKPCLLCVRAGATCEPQVLGQNHSPPLKRKRSIHSDGIARRPPGPSAQAQGQPQSTPAPTSVPSDDLRRRHLHAPTNSSCSPTDVADMTGTSPEDSRQQYGANDSTMGFAKFILGEDDESDSPASGTIPGDARYSNSDLQSFPWASSQWPAPSVLQAAVDAYFDRVNWYITLFHQPSFMVRTQNLVRRSAWRRDEICEVLLVGMVAVMGLRCVQYDKTWMGHRLLETYSVTAGSVIADLMSHIGARFYEVMLESRIEAYQICMLLTTYHVYFGSSNFAWNVSGVSSRTAYALALHCNKARDTDEIAREVGNRCWNHLVVSEQFSTMIFGRPAALDPAFAQFLKLSELDDMELPGATAALPILRDSARPVTFLTYHTLKFELYHIIREALQSFRVLQLPSPVSVHHLKAFIQVVNSTEQMLTQWHASLPAVFKPSQWSAVDPWNVLELDRCDPEERNWRRKIGLQAYILQLLYDAARVWAYRPLLKLRISLPPGEENVRVSLDDLPDSLGISVRAALRMSRIPVNEFDGQLAQSFVLMHLFTAGIILCIAPTCQPYTQMATEAKAGVLRIIAACRPIIDESKIAKHTDQMLTRLYKKTMEREMENALRVPDAGGRPKDRHTERQSLDSYEDLHSQRESMSAKMPQTQSTAAARGGGVDMEIASTPVTGQSDTTPSVVDYSHHPLPHQSHHSHPHHQNHPHPHATRAEEVPEEPVVSYLQFESLRHTDRMDFPLDEHIDEAYGAFEQMFNFDLGDFPFQPA